MQKIIMQYPKHVAIIPDWNRTRARENWKSTEEAYIISYRRGIDLIRYTFDNTPIKIFTLRWLSTENAHKRPKKEFDFLMMMYKIVDEDLDDYLQKNKINFKRIGDPEWVSDGFRKYLDTKTKRCACNSDRYFVFALNYWWRDEIIRWIKKLEAENIDFSKINETILSNSLDLSSIPPIELVIRTKWNFAHRTSWFMSRWIGYAELFFTEKKCPEFMIEEFKKALNRFDEIEQHRNFGK